TPIPLDALACGSRSTSKVRRSDTANEAARFTAVVVLPTPPFWLAIAGARARFPPGQALWGAVGEVWVARDPRARRGGRSRTNFPSSRRAPTDPGQALRSTGRDLVRTCFHVERLRRWERSCLRFRLRDDDPAVRLGPGQHPLDRFLGLRNGLGDDYA